MLSRELMIPWGSETAVVDFNSLLTFPCWSVWSWNEEVAQLKKALKYYHLYIILVNFSYVLWDLKERSFLYCKIMLKIELGTRMNCFKNYNLKEIPDHKKNYSENLHDRLCLTDIIEWCMVRANVWFAYSQFNWGTACYRRSNYHKPNRTHFQSETCLFGKMTVRAKHFHCFDWGNPRTLWHMFNWKNSSWGKNIVIVMTMGMFCILVTLTVVILQHVITFSHNIFTSRL